MGKKRVIAKTAEEALKEKEILEETIKKVGREVISRKTKRGNVYINASYNNTMITVTDEGGNVLAWATAGGLGFKGPKKATPFAASRVAEAVVEKVRKVGLEDVRVFVKGVGGGRESAIRSLAGQGLNISYIKDVTPIPHNGPRPPKVRRV